MSLLGPVNWILSLPIFQIFGRLSYSMYLVHVTTLYMISYSQRIPCFASDFDLVGNKKLKWVIRRFKNVDLFCLVFGIWGEFDADGFDCDLMEFGFRSSVYKNRKDDFRIEGKQK